MELLSDDTLLFSYYKAKELQLDDSFIHLLMEEIERRKLDVRQETIHTVRH